MTFAVIQTGGKQYKVKEGDRVKIEKLSGEYKQGDKITFDEVVLTDNGKDIKLGAPTVPGSKVEANFLEAVKGDKIRIQKFKSKSNYSKVTGHRQNYFLVEITSVK